MAQTVDIKLVQDEFGQFDFEIESGDLAPETGFDTAIWVSLLTDARANESQVIKPEDRRGWIGNVKSSVKNRDLGSLIWLTDQKRLNQDTLNETVDYVRKALNWFVEDGLATKINVSGEIIPKTGIQIESIITALNGVTQTYYIPMWELTGV